MPASNDVIAVVGAGPYGLAAAAHMIHAGLSVRVFGEPMEFWGHYMPKGMRLRSSAEASRISDPTGCLSPSEFELSTGRAFDRPVALADFVAYGKWFQQEAVPCLDRRRIDRIDHESGRFRLITRDGEVVGASRVVVAGGISRFAYRPPEFSTLPADLCSHPVEHRDLSRFGGQRVIVIGGGQSATESAALLAEAGADVELIVRESRLNWVQFGSWLGSENGAGFTGSCILNHELRLAPRG